MMEKAWEEQKQEAANTSAQAARDEKSGIRGDHRDSSGFLLWGLAVKIRKGGNAG